jgi:hypothetical protein
MAGRCSCFSAGCFPHFNPLPLAFLNSKLKNRPSTKVTTLAIPATPDSQQCLQEHTSFRECARNKKTLLIEKNFRSRAQQV